MIDNPSIYEDEVNM